jgi:PRTRC genetic system protein C
MDIQNLIREFRYNGVTLADPSAAMSLPQVRDFYANVYPEITSADIEGPEQVGAKVIYTFRRAVGTKGCEQIRVRTELRLTAGVDAATVGQLINSLGHTEQANLIDGLADLLPTNVLNDADSTLVKEAQLLVHTCRLAELPERDLGRLGVLSYEHGVFALELVAC